NDLTPIVDMMFPGTRAQVRTDYLNALLNVDFTSRLVGLRSGERGLVDIGIDAMDDIQRKAAAEEGRYQPRTEMRVLALSFPKTDCDDAGCRMAPIQTIGRSQFPKADLLRSGAVWKALRATDQCDRHGGRNVPVTILPRDLYSRDGGQRLSCQQAAPFVRGMATFFYYYDGDRSSRLNLLGFTTPSKVSQTLVFPDERGVNDY